MSGSIFGKLFKISTWGESHGKALGVVIDGCPAGIRLTASEIQKDLDRRKPGSSQFTTKRAESDQVQILSGVFEDKTTGTPISLIIFNEDQKSKDYGNIKDCFRPAHADYGYHMKYGFRDYRGGGRSSGRETAARVAAGAVAKKILSELNIDIMTYCTSIANIEISKEDFDKDEILKNPLYMPDREAYEKAAKEVEHIMQNHDSAGGVVECVVKGVLPGVGEPVFDKIDAALSQAIFSIGGVKALEFGIGFEASKLTGSQNNDSFYFDDKVKKATNNSGGILGGLTDGSDIIFRAAFKPTPSISKSQKTVNINNENVDIVINGRHDPLIAPRAVIVVEAMTAITLVDYILQNIVCKMDCIKSALQIK